MQKKHQALWGYLFIGPQFLGLLCFSLLPLLYAFYLSFVNWDGFGVPLFVGLDNFKGQLSDPDFWKALINTVYYMVLVIPVGIVLALLVAIVLNKVKGREIYRLFFFMPVVTSSVSVGVIWMWILNGEFGILNHLLRAIGIAGPMWLTDTHWVIPSIALLSIWLGLGYNMVIFLAGLQGISKSYYEAAEIDGASKFQQLRYITLPLLSPTTFFVTIMMVISSFQVFDQAFVMTNGGPAKASYTLVYHIYDQAFIDFTMGESAAAAMILFVIILIFTLLQFKMQKRWVHYGD
ncbi:carbohydrate ABC transporter permease [Paenibacillus polymyxa]|jgi:multiple sugar transport system permease protein|uniref:Sugar ABC transporter permease n=1 Tax=Paenibacillus polymyxa TaxID=1406 RepID=A0A0F0G621_PAEPO|nr:MULTISPECIES: sugar ABC transporter permease [Paenibacillus]MDP9678511.1 multiple sugar transport system permease protein [Paenibacillus jamilae]AHM63992.1 sugar ABC transporter permease [Paenibacillus polymyxa SQR-21]AIY09691.1 sugar ABC transporter permease [Paenibacillus polymyxa]AUS24518.1 sugar ABC transporter permease [Paenibacillus polymyxa]KAF6583678.1 sugar ABC transporter permease [Paenibacillus sp. EKM211P]